MPTVNRRHDAPKLTTTGITICGCALQAGLTKERCSFPWIAAGFKRVHLSLLKQLYGDREMVEVLHHDEQTVLTSSELTFDRGLPS